MSGEYIYSVLTNFGGLFDSGQFHQEIQADSSITTELIGINVNGDVIKINFVSDLSAGELIALNTLVTNYIYNTDPNMGFVATDIVPASTTSTTYVTRLELTTNYLPEDQYTIKWYYQYNTDNSIFESQVIVDNITVLEHICFNPMNQDPAFEYSSYGSFLIELTEGVHVIDLNYKAVAPGTVIINRAQLRIS